MQRETIFTPAGTRVERDLAGQGWLVNPDGTRTYLAEGPARPQAKQAPAQRMPASPESPAIPVPEVPRADAASRSGVPFDDVHQERGGSPDRPAGPPSFRSTIPFVGRYSVGDSPSYRREAPAFTKNYDMLVSEGEQRCLHLYNEKEGYHVLVVPERWNMQTHDEWGNLRINFGANADRTEMPAGSFASNSASFRAATTGAVTPEAQMFAVFQAAGWSLAGLLVVVALGVIIVRRLRGV